MTGIKMSYILCENNGDVIGTFVDESSAQTEADSLATAYASGDPDMTAKNNGTDLYAVVSSKTVSRDFSGITLVSTREDIVKSWKITTLSPP